MHPLLARPLKSLPALLLLAAAPALADETAPVNEQEVAVATAGTGPVWMPLEPGRSWTYVFARERSRETENGEETESLRGSLVQQVVGPSAEEGGVLVEALLRGRAEGQAAESIEKRRSFVEAGDGALRVLAREAQDPLGGEARLARFSPPLELIRAGVAPGETWHVGVDRYGDIRITFEAEILGLQDAQTPAGLYERCLVVRYTGRIEGGIALYGDRIEVRDGRLSATEWYAPGVGLVLAKEDLEQTLELSSGASLIFREKTQYALGQTAVAGAPPAAVAPPDEPVDPQDALADETPPTDTEIP